MSFASGLRWIKIPFQSIEDWSSNAKVLGFVRCGVCWDCRSQGVAQDLEHRAEPYEFKARSGAAVEAELGMFRVPENRSQATPGKAITLRYIRFPATTESPGPPIVYLAGGPGGSGSDAARGSRFEMFQALRQLGDVIAFDQRGTGMSDRLPASKHRWQVPGDQPATREVVSQAIQEAIQKSVADWREADVDLDAYNTRRKRPRFGGTPAGSWGRTTPSLRNQLRNPPWFGLHAVFSQIGPQCGARWRGRTRSNGQASRRPTKITRTD